MDSGIYSKLAGHAYPERFKEPLSILLDRVAQTLADDTPQDFSNCDWPDSTLGFLQCKEPCPGEIFSKLLGGAALCEQLSDLSQLLCDRRALRRGQRLKQVLDSEP